MSQHYFNGSHIAKLDQKNRFVLPIQMRHGLIEDGELQCTLALGQNGSLVIYKRSEIETIVERFRKKQHSPHLQKFFTLFFSTLHKTTCDSIGRISIPPMLKGAIGLKQEIVVAGVLNKIELWPKEIYEENLRLVLSGENSIASLAQDAFQLLDEEDRVKEEVLV
ncbi:MAG: Transcriptional regulator MraZ [Chlamydiae bacterium]|nr:Transcriptional regulator MraZ [Chlamydiota bacterium]